MPVAVEKLVSEKSAKIKTRQEALQGIYFDHLDILYLPISANFEEKGVFQQPPLFSTVISGSQKLQLCWFSVKWTEGVLR
jgi:hypothetical protein